MELTICILCTHRPSHQDICYPPLQLKGQIVCDEFLNEHGSEVQLPGSNVGFATGGNIIQLGLP